MRIAVGMSGGVDSAVAALLLKEEGHEVHGIFMKNWDEKDELGQCSSAADYEDAQAVCSSIGIPLYAVNFEAEYYERVFTHFLDEYAAGRTPNPDVLCNSEIKFKAFLNFAMKTGAQSMATGHYARLERDGERVKLLKGADARKDQSYFLCMLKSAQLQNALFPVGGLTKERVREIARERGLAVAGKKDSTGICFIGERNFRAFLKNYLPACPGDIVDMSGAVVGRHEGLMYYTLGQRRGLNIGGKGPGGRWFVVDKNLKTNTLVVTQGDQSPLYSRALVCTGLNLINPPPACTFRCAAKFRYRQGDQPVVVSISGQSAYVRFDEPQRAVTPGQYAAFYLGDECLGGGVIDEIIK